jgi:uncharacterized membrane protein YkvA (DUF1232 family)
MTEERDRSVTESNPSVYEPASSADTPIESAGWLFSGTTVHIDEFILAGSSRVCSDHLHAIVKESQRVYEKIYAIREVGLNDLKRQTRLIMQTLEFAAGAQATADPLPAPLAEGTFAAQYLLEEHDFFPDQIPGLGLVDDAILIKRVFSRSEREFMRLEILLATASSHKAEMCAR